MNNGTWKTSKPLDELTPTMQMSSYTTQVPENPLPVQYSPYSGVSFTPPPVGNPLGPYFDQFIPSYARLGGSPYGGSSGRGHYYNSFRRW